MAVRLSHVCCLTFSILLADAGVGVWQQTYAEVLTKAVGEKLQLAQQALKAHEYERARMMIKSALATSNKSDYDVYTILQMQVAVATASGNLKDTLVADRQLLNFKLTPNQQKVDVLLAESTMAYRAKDYPQAVESIKKYFAAGGRNPYMHTLLVQSYLLQKDYRNALREQLAQIDQEKKAGQVPAESQYQIIAVCQSALNNRNGQIDAYTQLVRYYPKADYWKMLIDLQLKEGSIPRNLLFDKYFLLYQTGLLQTAADYMTAAEVAVQSNLPFFADYLIADGYKKNILGLGPDATRQKRFYTFVSQKVKQAKAGQTALEQEAVKLHKGDALMQLGFDIALSGEGEKGLALMKQAQTMNITDANHASLHMAMASYSAGKAAQAIQELKKITGSDTIAQMARLWQILAAQKK